MFRHFFLSVSTVLFIFTLHQGCSSSKTTPQSEEGFESIDSVVVPTVSIDTVGHKIQPEEIAKLTAKDDTLYASIIQRSRSIVTQPTEPTEPSEVAFTVQIGAFTNTEYAMRLAKRAKQQFGDIPVLNTFEIEDKLYRVSVGLFPTMEEANAFKILHRDQFAREYKDAWIALTTR